MLDLTVPLFTKVYTYLLSDLTDLHLFPVVYVKVNTFIVIPDSWSSSTNVLKRKSPTFQIRYVLLIQDH